MGDKEAEYSAAQPVGGTMRPIYQERSVKCFVVSESELKQLGLANIGITAAASIGSFFLAFALDVMKDAWLLTDVPENARSVIQFVQPAGFALAALFYVVGGVLLWWRYDMIKLIKKESGDSSAGKGLF